MTIQHGAPGRVLVVEDEIMIAADIESILRERGIRDVVTALSIQEAMQAIADAPPDVAILDYRVRKDTTVSLAKLLLDQDLPFVFATGSGAGFSVPTELFHIPVVNKPFTPDRLMSSLYKAIGRKVMRTQ